MEYKKSTIFWIRMISCFILCLILKVIFSDSFIEKLASDVLYGSYSKGEYRLYEILMYHVWDGLTTIADIGNYIINSIFLFSFIVVVRYVILYNRKLMIEDAKNTQKYIKDKQDQIRKAKHNYEVALNSRDKAVALKKGRLYYSLLRNGNLTIYDEQALGNDLMTMIGNE